MTPDEPSLDAFRASLERDRVVPVMRRLLADAETPVSAYRKLADGRPGTFLLESAEHGGVWSRYSFVGVRSAATLTERDGHAIWLGAGPEEHPDDPLDALRDAIARLHTPRVDDGLPPLTGGLVGYLGYDAVRRMERLPELTADDLHLPELHFMLATDLAVLDHADGSILLIANVIRRLTPHADADPDRAYRDAVDRLDAMEADLAKPAESSVASVDRGAVPNVTGRTERADYLDAVEAAKRHIRAGDAFQVVVSQRFETEVTCDALDVYRVLRASNPSPYMYLLRFDDLDVVGSSPEVLVKVDGRRALMHPIAGTRPRGATPEDDARLAAELLADPKERAEHVMLVDLGRNDLGRVCEPGSVEVIGLLDVERYSHVMHLVSTVVGDVQPELSALDVLCACFPAGTLSGAPKVRAMEIIEDLEPTRRGVYGGIVGYVDVGGDMDTAIAIRTVVIREGRAYVQAGAGIVADSDAALEDAECRNKAAAVLAAVAAAHTLGPPADEPVTPRRMLLAVLAGCVLAGAVVLLAAGRVWGSVALTAQGGAHVSGSATGHDAVGALSALGFALLVLAGAIVAARGWLRVVVGVVTVVVGATVIVLALTSADDVASALRGEAFGVSAGQVHPSLSGWALITALAGAVAVAAGVLTVVRGATWPGLGAKYEAPGGPGGGATQPARQAEPTVAAWDALDRGEDPTT